MQRLPRELVRVIVIISDLSLVRTNSLGWCHSHFPYPSEEQESAVLRVLESYQTQNEEHAVWSIVFSISYIFESGAD